MTVTGAILIAVVLGPMAWLILRGGRATVRAAPQPEDAVPGLNRTSPRRWPPRRPSPTVPGRCGGPEAIPGSRGLRRSTQ